MSERFALDSEETTDAAVVAARDAIARGDLVVMPTDTVYGLAADAFEPGAVDRLRAAKGRGRDMPPPVLVASPTTLDALATAVPLFVRDLVEAFWPGPLTLVCHQQPSLTWDLGDARGTVAVRVPDHPVALAVLKQTGPLAVSSANLTGQPPAADADAAEAMLGDAVAVLIDDGPATGGPASTILDVTSTPPRCLRVGAIDLETLRGFCDDLLGPDDEVPDPPADDTDDRADDGTVADTDTDADTDADTDDDADDDATDDEVDDGAGPEDDAVEDDDHPLERDTEVGDDRPERPDAPRSP